jgi:hypothetical protein
VRFQQAAAELPQRTWRYQRAVAGRGDPLAQLCAFGPRPKREVYARCGTRELWLIDPDKKEVAIYDLREDAERPAKVLKESDTIQTALFPAWKCHSRGSSAADATS